MSDAATGTLKLKTSFMILNLIYFLFPARISVDGQAFEKLGWGDRELTMPAGRHEVTILSKVYFVLPCGKATTTVDIPAGGTATLDYRAPFVVFPGVGGKFRTV